MKPEKKRRNGWLTALIVLGVLLLLAAAVFAALHWINEYSLDLTLNGPGELTLEYGEPYEEQSAYAVYYGTIFQQEPVPVDVAIHGQVDTQKTGTYEVTYRAEYEGLTAEAVRRVQVVDTVPPELILNGETEITLEIGADFEEPGYGASDNYNGDLTAQVEILGDLDAAVPGTYVLTYKVSDESGNVTQATRSITYIDVTAPVLTLAGENRIVLEPGTAYEEPGYSAMDDCDGDLTASVRVDGEVDASTPGTYTLTYVVTDAAGNSSQAVREIVYKDVTAPTLTLYGDSVLQATIGSWYSDPGYSASDDCDGDLTAQVQVTSNIDLYLPGTYTVTYTVTDAAGNSTSKTRTVVMNDIVPKVSGGVIYLTFDDGPSANTAKLLDVLDQYGVKATFFVVSTKYNSTLSRIASSGHAIGIHSATHDYNKIYASEEAYFEDLYKMQGIIESYTGITTTLLRFPGGSSNSVSRFNPGIMTRLTQEVQARGFQYFDWNVNSLDAGVAQSAAESAYNVIKGLSTRTSSVVLMHDSKRMTPAAAERVIQWGLANGYTFAVLTPSSPGCHQKVNN